MTLCDSNNLSMYMDGELPPSRYREVVDHLRTCVDCRNDLAALRNVDQAVISWASKREAIPIATEVRVHSSIERRGRLGSLLRLSRMMPAALGTSVAALLVVVTMNLAPGLQGNITPSPESTRGIAQTSLKTQSQPLLYARGKSAVLGTQTIIAQLDPSLQHHPVANIY